MFGCTSDILYKRNTKLILKIPTSRITTQDLSASLVAYYGKAKLLRSPVTHICLCIHRMCTRNDEIIVNVVHHMTTVYLM